MTQSVSQLLPTNEWMNDKAVYRKSAATPGLLMKYQNVCLAIFLIFWHLILVISCPYPILPSQGFFYLLGQCEWIDIKYLKNPCVLELYSRRLRGGFAMYPPPPVLSKSQLSLLLFEFEATKYRTNCVNWQDMAFRKPSLSEERYFYTSFKTIVVFNPYFSGINGKHSFRPLEGLTM